MDSFEKFIVENGNADTVRVVMACKEWPVPEDAELAELERRRDKTRMIKQGMMQELLTGRTRLL